MDSHVIEVDHPLVRHKLGLLRDVTTTTQQFRQLVNELTLLLTYEATKTLADEAVEIETPLERMGARRISGKKVAVCPILRAGVGMLDGVLSLIPGARVGFIGLYRDEETLQPVEYYVKLPNDIAERDVLLLDPMLATGNSTAAAVETVKARRRDLGPADRADRDARGDRADPPRPSRRVDRRRVGRPRPEREGLHRPGARGRRRQALRHEVGGDERASGQPGGPVRRGDRAPDRRPPDARRSAAWRGSSASSTTRTRGGSTGSPIPRLGGLAIFLGILVPSLAFLDLSGEMRGILLGAAVACVVGAIDDFRGLSPVAKLAGQVLAAAIPTAFGVWIDHFTLPFLGAVDVPPWIGVPLTIIWIVAVMNMVNFLDGMDGLASGVCAISGVTFAVIALSLGKVDAAVLSAIVAGACVGFLRHNFFPARIFMGDSGALVLGFTLASVSVAGSAEDGVDRGAVPAAARPRGADHRHVVRRPQAPEVPPADLGRRPLAPPPPLHQHRLQPAPRRADDVGVDGVARGRGARDALHPVPRGRRLAPVADGRSSSRSRSFALAFSVYIVYLLEIVKLGNPRVRRRVAEREAEERALARRPDGDGFSRPPGPRPAPRTPPASR